jgi:hypothetical protein
MKDRDAFLDDMIRNYEDNSGYVLSTHDPIFHAFNSVANIADILSAYGDKEARERYILTAKRRNSVISHAIGYGYTPRFLEPDRHVQVINFSDAVPEELFIPKNTRIRTEIEEDSYTVAEVMEDTVVPVGSTSIEVVVEVGQTVELYIGDGTGVEKSLPLEGDFVYVDSLTLRVETPFGTETWTKVDNFLQSEEDDQHFIVDIGAKNFNDMMRPNDLMLYVRCGNGVSGKIFPENSRVYAIYREVNPYQDTMPLGVFTTMEDEIMYVDSTTNTSIEKEKVLPEDTETIRRNAIFTKSIGNSLITKEDLERATILQSIDKIYKAYAESSVTAEGKTLYTIYVSGDGQEVLTQEYLDSVRDKMYEEYSRNMNDEYQLTLAPTQNELMELSVMFEEDTSEERKLEIKDAISEIIQSEIFYLDLGVTYSIPRIWTSIINETSGTLKGLEYVQINTAPPVVTYNAELKVPKENITFIEM